MRVFDRDLPDPVANDPKPTWAACFCCDAQDTPSLTIW
jgi:hypothetical protein